MLARIVGPLTAAVLAVMCAAASAHADPAISPSFLPSPSPRPSTSPQPAASATPRAPRLVLRGQSITSYVNEQYAGPGTVPPEATLFAGGSPVSPGTPYDDWTSSPTVTGQGLSSTLLLGATYAISPAWQASATLGAGTVLGTGNAIEYWGEQPLPSLNAHLGSAGAALRVPIAFPTHDGQDAIALTRVNLLSAALSRTDGALALRAGWFDLAQTETFVFNPPAQTSTPIAFTEPLPEGLGDPPASLDLFGPGRTTLPLFGVDAIARPNGATTIELTDAALPQPFGTAARLRGASVEIASGGGASYAGEIVRVTSAGAAVPTTILFGGSPVVVDSPLGPLPVSFLNAQADTIAGVRASFPFVRGSDVQLRGAISCYGATGTAESRPQCTHGQYLHAKLHRPAGKVDLALEAVRFEASFAPMILPYGTPENLWSIAYSWPGTWLKGDYQLVSNAQVGPNRQGLRATTSLPLGGITLKLAFAQYRQILPYDTTTAFAPGFVEGFFLPQLFAAGTLGKEEHAALSLSAHPRFADVSLDLTDITLSRPGSLGHPNEAVAMDYPAATLALSRKVGRFAASAGVGRYATDGAFDTAGRHNADLTERVLFGSLQYGASERLAYALQYRLYDVSGLPTAPFAAPPAYHGPQFLFEQRLRL